MAAMVLTVFNPKGGAGKSTTACNLAAMFASIGYATAVVETDTASDQASSGNWVMTRSGTKLPQVKLVMISLGEDVRHAIHSLRSDPSLDIIIVDVSGRDSNVNRAALLESTAWLIPVKPTQNDLARVPYIQAMSDDLIAERPDMLIHLFINEAPTTNKIETRNAFAFIRELGIEPMKTVIHTRKAYRDCIAEGLGVVEMTNTDGKAAAEFAEFFAELMQDYRQVLEENLIISDNIRQIEATHPLMTAGSSHGGV